MQNADIPDFHRLVSEVMAFYKQPVSDFALSVWWEACRSYSLEQVSKALTAHAMDPDRGQFPPKPADLVRVLQGTHQDRALVAWGAVYAAMGRHGAYASVTFNDPAIHCAIEDMGGWPALCRMETDQLGYVQKRFCDAFRAYSSRGEAVRDTPYLIGIHEATNRAAGKPVSQPILIGDACKPAPPSAATSTPARRLGSATPLAHATNTPSTSPAKSGSSLQSA